MRSRLGRGAEPSAARAAAAPLTDAAWAGLWLAGYTGAALLSMVTVLPEVGIALFWPAAGVAALCVLSAGTARRCAWAAGVVVAGTLLVGALHEAAVVPTLVFAVAHTLQAFAVRAVVGVLGRRAGPTGVRVTTPSDVFALLAAAGTGAALSAPVAAFAAALDSGRWSPLVPLTWTVRNGFAVLVVTAALVHLAEASRTWPVRGEERPLTWWMGRLTPAPRPRAAAELAALVITAVGLTALVLAYGGDAEFVFLVVTLAVWAGHRFAPVVAGSLSLLLATVATAVVSQGAGPFGDVTSPSARAAALQLFIGITAMVGLLLAASREEQQRLTRRLTEQSDRFDRIIERLDDFVWSVEVHGQREVSLVYASANGARFFGGTEPVLGRRDLWLTSADLVHPPDAAAFERFIATIEKGEPSETEVRLVGADGLPRWAWVRALPRREGGRLFVDGITTDVDDRKAVIAFQDALLRQQERRVRELRGLEKMREQFLAIAGHELRTPLTVIRGYAELLAERLGHDPVTTAQAHAVVRRTRQLERLVGDFFDLAKFQAGRVELVLEPVRLDELVRTAVVDLRATAAEQGLTLELDSVPVVLRADAARLRQVVDNLLTNAITYTPAGGRVVVSCASDGERALLSVSDTGVGVDPEELPHLFDHFFRASTADRQSVHGTGLGLAIVKAVVEAHHGFIDATTNPGGGLTVSARLPRVHSDDADDAADLRLVPASPPVGPPAGS